MKYKEVDNRGLSCPQPVINTKKALDELARGGTEEFKLTVIVDNDVARENVSRFAGTAGYAVSVEQKAEGAYIHIQGKGESKEESKGESKGEALASPCCAGGAGGGGTVFLVSSATLGQGSEELGKILMRGFIFSLKESGCPPAKMLFLNSGVFLTTEGSPVLEELAGLAAMGTEIFSCGTCLDYYQLKDKLQVGAVTNMYDTLENIMGAAKCVTLP